MKNFSSSGLLGDGTGTGNSSMKIMGGGTGTGGRGRGGRGGDNYNIVFLCWLLTLEFLFCTCVSFFILLSFLFDLI